MYTTAEIDALIESLNQYNQDSKIYILRNEGVNNLCLDYGIEGVLLLLGTLRTEAEDEYTDKYVADCIKFLHVILSESHDSESSASSENSPSSKNKNIPTALELFYKEYNYRLNELRHIGPRTRTLIAEKYAKYNRNYNIENILLILWQLVDPKTQKIFFSQSAHTTPEHLINITNIDSLIDSNSSQALLLKCMQDKDPNFYVSVCGEFIAEYVAEKLLTNSDEKSLLELTKILPLVDGPNVNGKRFRPFINDSSTRKAICARLVLYYLYTNNDTAYQKLNDLFNRLLEDSNEQSPLKRGFFGNSLRDAVIKTRRAIQDWQKPLPGGQP